MKPYSAREAIQYGCVSCELYFLKGTLMPTEAELRPVCPSCGRYVCSALSAKKWLHLYGGRIVGAEESQLIIQGKWNGDAPRPVGQLVPTVARKAHPHAK